MSWCVRVKLVRKVKGEVKTIYDEWIDDLKNVCERNIGAIDNDLVPWFSSTELEMPEDVASVFKTEHPDDGGAPFVSGYEWKFYTSAVLSNGISTLEKNLCDVAEKMNKIDSIRGTLDYMKLSSDEKGNVDEEYSMLKEERADITLKLYPLAFLRGLFYPYWDSADEKTYLGIMVA